MRIIAVDPGLTTGFCYAKIMENHLYYWPFQMVDDVEEFNDRLEKFNPDYIVMEDFEFRGKARTGLVLFSVQLIGVAQLFVAKAPQVGFKLQKAAQGKSYYTDKMLKSLGLYVRGIPHGMDASRHLLHWSTFGPGYQFFQGQQTKNFATILEEWA